MTEKKQVLIMRIFIVFFIIVSAVIAIIKDANPGVTFIAQMMGVSWGGLAGAFLAPYLYGLYSKKVTKASVVVCFIWGTGLAITQFAISMAGVDVAAWPSFFALMFKTSIHSGAFAMIGGLIIVPLVSLFTKKPSNEFVDKIFACYDQKVQTSVKESLGE